MSLYGGGNTGSTYQSIVIALVAGGILSTGVLSILWKRRQARRWMEMRRRLPVGGDAARGSGPGVGGSVGREPGIWDVVFGSGSGDEKKIIEGEGTNEKEGMDGDELDLDGSMRNGWRPTSLSLTPSAVPPIPDPKLASNPPPPLGQTPHVAGITVLIAMPDPNSPSSSSPIPPHRSSSTYDLPSYSSIYHYPASTSQVQGYDDEEDDGRPLPLLEMGQTSIPINLPSKGVSDPILDNLLSKATAEREAASIPRRHRNRSTAWDGVTPPPAQAVNGGSQQASRPAGSLPMPEHQSLAARMAMIRNGALAGFGAAPTRR